MGILDDFEILNEDEVYYSIRKNPKDDESIFNIKKERCFITKNPCLHPADIRIVKAISTETIK